MMKTTTARLIPERTVERLCSYRRILFRWRLQGKQRFHSRELAEDAGITPEQVRRDMMVLRSIGTPQGGYGTDDVIQELGLLIEGDEGQQVVLVGAGNLGSAIAGYLDGIRPELRIVAVFDNDPAKVGKTANDVPCLALSDLARTVRQERVLIGIITVPGSVAQEMAMRLVEAGIKAIVNFSPVRLKVPPEVFVEDVDISIELEKAAYFARMCAADSNS